MEKNNSISILYVEDQDDVRLFLSKILSRHYETIFLAENGKQGLDLYLEHQPDIIISDIKMPVMDGLSMSSRIKEINPKARIILTTAHSDMEYFIQSIDIGLNQYILKPIDRQKLYAAINNCKDQVMLEREIETKNNKIAQSNKNLIRHERELRENLQKTIALKEIISRSEENFRKVAENIQDAFWLSDNTNIIFINKAFELLFEHPADQMYDNPSLYQNFILQQDKEKFLEAIEKHEESQSGSFSFEFRIKTTSGRIKNIWYRDVFIESSKTNENRRLSTLSDISWKIENEALKNELTVAENSAKIKQRLLANVSHEIRTPLNGIFAMAEIMSETNLDNQQLEYIETIKESADLLEEITDNLLDINDLSKDGIHEKQIQITSSTFFQPILNKYQEKALEKGLTFHSVFSDSFPETFYSDPEKLKILLGHFFSNAIKFTSNGSIFAEFISESIDDTTQRLKLSVTDTGTGIKKEYLDKMFTGFSQQENSDSRSYEGLGLGLTICNKIASILHGEINVESKDKKGSKFTFSLLVKTSDTTDNKNDHIPDKQPLKINAPTLNLSVLYVEDKEVNQKIVSLMLQNAQCKTDIAANGLEAIELVEKNQYDIILMDIQMPVMDGITATKELKKKHPNLPPIIGVSANALKADARYYISQGLDDYISKPVVPAILYAKINQWVNKDGKSKPFEEQKPSDNKKTLTTHISAIDDLDTETIESLKEQTNNDTLILNDLFGTFIQEADQLIEKIDQSIEKNDNKSIREATHALKGLSATIGASKVYYVTAEMDKLHKKNLFTQTPALFKILKENYTSIKIIIESTLLKN